MMQCIGWAEDTGLIMSAGAELPLAPSPPENRQRTTENLGIHASQPGFRSADICNIICPPGKISSRQSHRLKQFVCCVLLWVGRSVWDRKVY